MYIYIFMMHKGGPAGDLKPSFHKVCSWQSAHLAVSPVSHGWEVPFRIIRIMVDFPLQCLICIDWFRDSLRKKD